MQSAELEFKNSSLKFKMPISLRHPSQIEFVCKVASLSMCVSVYSTIFGKSIFCKSGIRLRQFIGYHFRSRGLSLVTFLKAHCDPRTALPSLNLMSWQQMVILVLLLPSGLLCPTTIVPTVMNKSMITLILAISNSKQFTLLTK